MFRFSSRPVLTKLCRALAIATVVLLALVAGSAATNEVLNRVEQSSVRPYGQRVPTAEGEINVTRSGGAGPTIVLLSGYGTAAPGVDFAPLIRELSDFDVIVVEGFGYGYSSRDVADRTIENITAELHDVLDQLHITGPVILLGHSVGGLYARYYAHRYPGEVAAIIGIDPMIATASTVESGSPSRVAGFAAATGLFRVVTAIAPDLVQPDGDAYTAGERDRTAAMSNWNYGNRSVADEGARIGANSTKAAAAPFDIDIPVLEILASQTVASTPTWLSRHQAEVAGVTVHEVHVLNGAHYLHWTQSPAIARLISTFVATNLL